MSMGHHLPLHGIERGKKRAVLVKHVPDTGRDVDDEPRDPGIDARLLGEGHKENRKDRRRGREGYQDEPDRVDRKAQDDDEEIDV